MESGDGSVVRVPVVIERSRLGVPAGTAGDLSSPGSTVCADSYFGIGFTAVARKRARSFCQTCRWQVTNKHAGTQRVWLCMK